jgi:cytochrome c-type biogenesis protein CcmH
LALFVAALSLAQTASELNSAAVKRVGIKLACLCGSCKNTVADCQMLHCGYSSPARQKIAAMQAAGSTDQQIVDAFVKERGVRALAVPPAEGFNLLGWIMPFIALAAGLGLIWWFIKRYRAPIAATPEGPNLNEAEFNRYRDRIEKDLAKLD